MGTWIRRHYVGLAALVVALGGTAYAATAAKNSVTSKSIKRAAVKSSDLRNDGVRGIDVNEATLDFSGLSELVGPPGEQGQPGEQGPPGDRGPQGIPGPVVGGVDADSSTPAAPAILDAQSISMNLREDITLPASGRLLVFGMIRSLGIGCSAGTGDAFLSVDGEALPESGQPQPAATDPPFLSMGISPVLPAGSHFVTVAGNCPAGNYITAGTEFDDTGKVGAILLDD